MLIVETGAKEANANSYVTLAEAAAYHELFGNLDWAGDDATLEAALIQGCRAMEVLYGAMYMGIRLYGEQSLLYPRYTFNDRDYRLINQGTIPKPLKDAQCEIALSYLLGNDAIPEADNTSLIASKSVEAGGVKSSTSYHRGIDAPMAQGYRTVELILQPILRSKVNTNIEFRR